MKRILSATPLLVALVGCQAAPQGENVSEAQSDVFNGTPANPLQALVVRLSAGGLACSGTLVSPEWVLTAGHCIPEPHDPNQFTVTLGALTTRHVTHIALHPEWSAGTDVAMLHVDVPYTEVDTSAVGIWQGDTNFLYNQTATCFGYGGTGSSLNKASLKIIPDTPEGLPSHADPDRYYELLIPSPQSPRLVGGDSGGSCWLGSTVVGVHKSGWTESDGSLHNRQNSGEAFGAWANTRRDCEPFSPAAFSTSFCTPDCPCDVGEGDCDGDDDCRSGLVCRQNVGAEFGLPPSADVCAKPTSSWPFCPAFNAAAPNASYCVPTADCPCNVGEGDCDQSADCGGSLVCVHNVGAAVGLPADYDICDYAPASQCPFFDSVTPSTGFCSAACPCGIGQGDCDNDDQCRGGLVCKNDMGALVGLPADYDICLKP